MPNTIDRSNGETMLSEHGQRSDALAVTQDAELYASWDRKYYLHAIAAQAEYSFQGVLRDDGNYIYLMDGSRLLDFTSQAISDSMGHRHPRIHAAIAQAMERHGHVSPAFATEYRAHASKLIIEDLLGGEAGWAGRVRLHCSGTEAVEGAIMMARLYTGRPIVLTQRYSFHGWTSGSTHLPGYRNHVVSPDAVDGGAQTFTGVAGWGIPPFPNLGYAAIPAPERHDWQGSGDLPSLSATESIIQAIGASQIAAVITEPVFGSAAIVPHERYLPELRALTKQYGILWIDDEIITGFCRLGEWFGYQRFPQIEPDLMTVGKGLNSCALPAAGVIASHAIAEYFDRARWLSGSTNEGHPLVCASIIGNITAMIEEDVLGRVRERGAYLGKRLDALADSHACVGRLAGLGLCYMMDLVDAEGKPIVPEDRDYLSLGDVSRSPGKVIERECRDRGVLISGIMPNSVKLAPPFAITEDEIDYALGALDEALTVIDSTWGDS